MISLECYCDRAGYDERAVELVSEWREVYHVGAGELVFHQFRYVCGTCGRVIMVTVPEPGEES